MPTYEYVCDKCGHAFECFQPMTEKALAVCPKAECPQKRWGRGRVRRTIGGGAGLIFKGSGFYITDYRSEGYKQAAKKESAPAGSGSDASKTAPKPGATPTPGGPPPSAAKKTKPE